MTISLNTLYQKGYTIRQAARAVDRSAPHVLLVLKGARKSPNLVKALLALPNRELNLRRPAAFDRAQ